MAHDTRRVGTNQEVPDTACAASTNDDLVGTDLLGQIQYQFVHNPWRTMVCTFMPSGRCSAAT